MLEDLEDVLFLEGPEDAVELFGFARGETCSPMLEELLGFTRGSSRIFIPE